MIAWWRRLVRRHALERELDAELRDHVERSVADLVRAGVSVEDARRQSLVGLGGLEPAKEHCRQARGTMLVEQTGRDIVFAVRQLRRQPTFWASVIVTLVLGIATSTSMFAIVNGVLLRPLPFADPDRLVSIANVGYRGVYVELRDRSQTMMLGGFTQAAPMSLTQAGDPVRLRVGSADARLFDVLGVPPALGRRFLPDDVRPGAAPVVVLSDGLWQRQFGGERSILDQPITLEGIPYTVIGVMPPDFRFLSVDVWIPLIINAADTSRANTVDLWANSANMVGRLREGVRLEQADQEVRVIVPPLRERFPWSMPEDFGRNAAAVPLQEQIVGNVRPTLLILLASVVAVLLMLGVNVANLLLTRGLSRERELTIRAAVGATRTRLIRQLVIESLTVAVVACVLGVATSVALLRVTLALLPADVPRVTDITIDGTVLAFALGVSVVTGLLFGVLPALHASRSTHRLALSGARAAALHVPERRASRVLATAQLALAVLLVASAALLGRSLVNLLTVDPGFRAEQLVTANIAPPRQRYGTPGRPPQLAPAYYQFVDALLAQVSAAPGVRSVAAGFAAPFAGQPFGSVFAIEGRPDPATKAGDWAMADVLAPTTPDYHRVLGVTLLEGRPFSGADRADTERVVIVSRSLARRYWGTVSPVGQRIRFPGGPAAPPWMRIVGVAADIKWNSLGEEYHFSGERATDFLRSIYVPLAQSALFSPNGFQLIVRTDADSAQLAANLRSIVRSLDRETPVSDIRSGEAGIAESLARPRFTALLVTVFAVMALLLGAIGVYGVLAYAVGRRTQEFAVRLALGADASDVLRGVLGEGARLTLVGVGVGLVGASFATRALSRLLFGVMPTDPVTFGAVAVILVTVGLLASYVPARRAMHVDPVAALQAE